MTDSLGMLSRFLGCGVGVSGSKGDGAVGEGSPALGFGVGVRGSLGDGTGGSGGRPF